jgi:glycosyltransferase involved in cell wall biosynthesis
VRVCFVSHSAASDHLGGSELSLLQIIDAGRTASADFDVLVVTPSGRGVFAAELAARGLNSLVAPFEGWAHFGDPGGRPEAAGRLRRDFASTRKIIARLREFEPDLVVTNTVVAPWGAYAAAALGIPHVWLIREFPDESERFRFTVGRRTALADVGLLSTLVVTNSHALREAIAAEIGGTPLKVAYPIVDALRVREQAAAAPSIDPFSPDDQALRLVQVGRITRSKGQWRVVEALGRLRSRGIQARVCFVGSTVEADADSVLMTRARHLGIADSIRFAREQSNPFPFVAAADVGITASDREAFGRSTLEYLLLGKPVIGVGTAGTRELVVDGECGYLVDPDDIEALADRIARYAADDAILAAHSAAATRRGEEVAREALEHDLVGELVEASRRSGVRLPETVIGWLEAPELYPDVFPRLTRTVLAIRHFLRRVRRAAAHPLSTLNRRRLRRRHRRTPLL